MSDTNRYAVRITGNGFQAVIEMCGDFPGPPGTNQFERDVDYVISRIRAADTSAPLMAVDEENKRATLVVPAPGMAYNILPWADHLEEHARAQAMRQAQAQALGHMGSTGLRMPPAHGRGKARR